jgi:hypothetical protein
MVVERGTARRTPGPGQSNPDACCRKTLTSPSMSFKSIRWTLHGVRIPRMAAYKSWSCTRPLSAVPTKLPDEQKRSTGNRYTYNSSRTRNARLLLMCGSSIVCSEKRTLLLPFTYLQRPLIALRSLVFGKQNTVHEVSASLATICKQLFT